MSNINEQLHYDIHADITNNLRQLSGTLGICWEEVDDSHGGWCCNYVSTQMTDRDDYIARANNFWAAIMTSMVSLSSEHISAIGGDFIFSNQKTRPDDGYGPRTVTAFHKNHNGVFTHDHRVISLRTKTHYVAPPPIPDFNDLIEDIWYPEANGEALRDNEIYRAIADIANWIPITGQHSASY